MDTHPSHPTPASGSMFQGASPKLTFLFGIVTGVAAASLIGALILIPKSLGKDKSGSTTTTNTTVANTNTAAPAQTFNDVKPVTDADYVRGDKNAEITLIEYTDLECPFCKSFHPTMLKVMEEYKGKVRWVYRQFPLSFHQNARKESEALLCVGKLGGNDAFWSYADKIFERTTANGTGFPLENLGPLAKEVGVDEGKFKTCLDSGEMAARVSEEETDGTTGGVSGTPTVLIVKDGKTINGIPGAYPYEQVKTFIDQALAS